MLALSVARSVQSAARPVPDVGAYESATAVVRPAAPPLVVSRTRAVIRSRTMLDALGAASVSARLVAAAAARAAGAAAARPAEPWPGAPSAAIAARWPRERLAPTSKARP